MRVIVRLSRPSACTAWNACRARAYLLRARAATSIASSCTLRASVSRTPDALKKARNQFMNLSKPPVASASWSWGTVGRGVVVPLPAGTRGACDMSIPSSSTASARSWTWSSSLSVSTAGVAARDRSTVTSISGGQGGVTAGRAASGDEGGGGACGRICSTTIPPTGRDSSRACLSCCSGASLGTSSCSGLDGPSARLTQEIATRAQICSTLYSVGPPGWSCSGFRKKNQPPRMNSANDTTTANTASRASLMTSSPQPDA